jgi:succinate dehydrogenase hydrophobic anchor subunit
LVIVAHNLPLLFLVGGLALSGLHGAKVRSGSSGVVDWVMLASGLALLALSVWGLYRALWVHRKFYARFYSSRQGQPPANS